MTREYSTPYVQTIICDLYQIWVLDTPGLDGCVGCELVLEHADVGELDTVGCEEAGCPAGWYLDLTGPTCVMCPSGTYRDTALHMSACGECPETHTSRPGSSTCDLCVAGHFWSSSSLECKSCPDNARCVGADHMPVPEPGYWTYYSEVMDYGEEIFTCFDDRCR